MSDNMSTFMSFLVVLLKRLTKTFCTIGRTYAQATARGQRVKKKGVEDLVVPTSPHTGFEASQEI